jgi:hypothetical protein
MMRQTRFETSVSFLGFTRGRVRVGWLLEPHRLATVQPHRCGLVCFEALIFGIAGLLLLCALPVGVGAVAAM